MLYRWRLTVIEPQFLGGTIAWPGAAASSAATAPRTTAGTRGVNRRTEIIASHNARGTRSLRCVAWIAPPSPPSPSASRCARPPSPASRATTCAPRPPGVSRGGALGRLEHVVVEREPRAAPRRLDRGRGPERDVAVHVEVVRVRRRARALEEDLPRPAAEHVGEVAVVGLARDLDARGADRTRSLQAAHDVARLVLDEREVRRAVVAIGAEDREEVREAR